MIAMNSSSFDQGVKAYLDGRDYNDPPSYLTDKELEYWYRGFEDEMARRTESIRNDEEDEIEVEELKFDI